MPEVQQEFENTSNVIWHMMNIQKIKVGAPELKALVANMGEYKHKACKDCRKMLTNLSMHRYTKKKRTEEAKEEAREEEDL
jgi:hypothetical protein